MGGSIFCREILKQLIKCNVDALFVNELLNFCLYILEVHKKSYPTHVKRLKECFSLVENDMFNIFNTIFVWCPLVFL